MIFDFRAAMQLAQARALMSLKKSMYPGTHHNQNSFVLRKYPRTPTRWRVTWEHVIRVYP